MLKDGKLNAYWVQCTNNMQTAPNMNEEGYPGYRNPDNFVVVSDPYPTVTALAADLILPTAMWMEKEGAYGNAERRTQFWRQQVKAPGEARSDLWQMMEFSKYFKIEEVWPEELIAKKPELRGKTLYDVLYANGVVNKFPLDRDARRASTTTRVEALRLLRAEGPVRGIRRSSAAATPTIWRSSSMYHKARGLRWPVVDSKETLWRFREGYDPYVKPGEGVSFYGKPDKKARIIFCPYEPAAEIAGQGVRPVAVHRPRAGALALRLDDAARAGAASLRAERDAVHAPGRRRRAQAAARPGGQDPDPARRGRHARRDQGPQQAAARARVLPVLRREPAGQQADARRDLPDLEGDRLQEVRLQGRDRLT